MIATRFLLWLKGQYVGEDSFGNRYYEEKFLFSKPNRPPRRWVYYKGEADASRIPCEWHGWIHFTHEAPLERGKGLNLGDNEPRKLEARKEYVSCSGSSSSLLSPSASRYKPWVPEGYKINRVKSVNEK